MNWEDMYFVGQASYNSIEIPLPKILLYKVHSYQSHYARTILQMNLC